LLTGALIDRKPELYAALGVPDSKAHPMKKVEDYRQHAEECRSLAKRARSPEEREMLLKMAGTWDSLAADRLEHLARQKRIAAFDNGGQSIPIDHLNASNDE
jgi:hypothetical protein